MQVSTGRSAQDSCIDLPGAAAHGSSSTLCRRCLAAGQCTGPGRSPRRAPLRIVGRDPAAPLWSGADEAAVGSALEYLRSCPQG